MARARDNLLHEKSSSQVGAVRIDSPWPGLGVVYFISNLLSKKVPFASLCIFLCSSMVVVVVGVVVVVVVVVVEGVVISVVVVITYSSLVES